MYHTIGYEVLDIFGPVLFHIKGSVMIDINHVDIGVGSEV